MGALRHAAVVMGRLEDAVYGSISQRSISRACRLYATATPLGAGVRGSLIIGE